MAEARFIKTVTFGGYEKTSVIQKLEHLNTQVHDLSNKLTESRALLDAYKKGTDEEKAHETILSAERARLTQAQVQNDTLTTKLKASEEENRNYVLEIKNLRKTLAELQDTLKDTETKLRALQTENEAVALSNVFIEAQKSSKMLEESSKEKCAALEENAKKLAVSIVEEANSDAEQIIFEANKSAKTIIADAQNKAEQMGAASNNLRAAVLNDVNALKDEINTMQNILSSFHHGGMERLNQTERLLAKTRQTLTEGGVPVFREPKRYEPELPAPPQPLSQKRREAASDSEEKHKKQQELDKLMQMANALGSKQQPKSDAGSEDTKPSEPEKKSGGIDLAALTAKANAIGKPEIKK